MAVDCATPQQLDMLTGRPLGDVKNFAVGPEKFPEFHGLNNFITRLLLRVIIALYFSVQVATHT